MAENPAQAVAAITEFEESKEAEALERAANILAGVNIRDAKDLAGRRELRRGALHGWIALLNAIDKYLDPDFDPDDVPALSLEPTQVLGHRYPPGADPEAIADLAARHAYETAIETNSEKAQAYNLQVKLRRLDETATRLVETLARISYLPIPLDQEELAAALELVQQSERKSALRKSMPLEEDPRH